jgi:hypothetical protein
MKEAAPAAENAATSVGGGTVATAEAEATGPPRFSTALALTFALGAPLGGEIGDTRPVAGANRLRSRPVRATEFLAMPTAAKKATARRQDGLHREQPRGG